MNALQSTFDAMRNAVIEGSKLRQEFDTLKAQVEKMQAELSKNTQYAKSLEESLASMRTARDNAVTESASLRNENRTLKAQLEAAQNEVQTGRARIAELAHAGDGLRKERDDAQLSAMEWEEKANSFRAVVDGIREKLSALGMSLPVQHPAEPVQHEPAPVTPEQDTFESVPGVTASPVPPQEGSQSSMGTGSSQDGGGGGVDSEGRPIQPRDPVTQRWQSPYNEI